ncbi:MAG: hypothetical protein ACM3SP_19075 [Chloroflexota bacterium]|jgi:hypothetical protein
MPDENINSAGSRIMLVGSDYKQILERRFQAAGCQVVKVRNHEAAFDQARHEIFDKTVLVSRGSLINVAETIFNLRDLNRSMEIIVVVDRLDRQINRFLRQLLEHPIEGTRIVTRRQLQQQMHLVAPAAPPGNSA